MNFLNLFTIKSTSSSVLISLSSFEALALIVFAYEMNKSQKLLLETAVRSTIGFGEGVLLPTMWHLTRGRDKIHDNPRSCGSV
jgi:hypothetical protein